MTTTEVSDDDFQEILAQTRHFVRTAVVPREQEILTDDRVPDDLREHAKKMGLFGYAIPQEWGGLGLNLAQDVELAMELGYTSLALRSMFGTNNGIAGQVLVGFGTDEQKSRWLEPMASGDVVASFALTEPGAGSNPSGLRTKAVRDGRTRLGDHRPEALHHQCADGRPVHRLRAHSTGRRRRRGHRGVPGARRRRRRGGRRQGRQDGPGRRVDLRRQLRRCSRARRCAHRRQRGHRLPRGDDLVGARSRPYRRAGGRHRTARARRIRRVRRHRHTGRHTRSATSSWCRR